MVDKDDLNKKVILINLDEEKRQKLERLKELKSEITKKEEEIKDLEDFELDEDRYDEGLDDCYPKYTIGNMEFTASQILKNCDSVAYEIGKTEEEDYLRTSQEDDLEIELDDLMTEREELLEELEINDEELEIICETN